MRRSIRIDASMCVGCRACEVACSFHHRKVFSRSLASIQVCRISAENRFMVLVYKERKTGHIPCDKCRGENEPLCVKFCTSGALIAVEETANKR